MTKVGNTSNKVNHKPAGANKVKGPKPLDNSRKSGGSEDGGRGDDDLVDTATKSPNRILCELQFYN